MKVIMLYGLPCSGKSTVRHAMQECQSLAVDNVITQLVENPELSDFNRLSDTIVKSLYKTLEKTDSNCYLIEMGCLINRTSSQWLYEKLSNKDWQVVNVKLEADDQVLIERIVKRNQHVKQGISGAIIIDGPDYLTRFKKVFDTECPEHTININTSKLSQSDVAERVNRLYKNS